jgi:hypothetical protein
MASAAKRAVPRLQPAILLLLAVALAVSGCSDKGGSKGGAGDSGGNDGDGNLTEEPSGPTEEPTGELGNETDPEPAVSEAFVFEASVSTDCVTQCGGCLPQVGCAGGPAPGAKGCLGFNAGVPEQDCVWTELTTEMAGKPFTAESTSGDPDLEFLAACDPASESISTSLNPDGETGKVPAGAGCVVIWEFNSAPSTITFTVS